jgi:uncharacterized coiled-coil DUF342 family protein
MDQETHQLLSRMAQAILRLNEQVARHHARLVALRRAIAQLHPEDANLEKQLQGLETAAQDEQLKLPGYDELDALRALLQAGKNPDKADA